MTKTLSEQWREGTLAGGDYYIKTIGLGIDKIIINYYEEELKQFDGLCDCSVAEVLAPVPSYDKIREMSQKIERLEFDNEALETVYNEVKEENSELEQYNKDLLQDHTRLVMECDRLLAENKQLVSKTDEFKDPYITNTEDCQQIVEDNLKRRIKLLEERLEVSEKEHYRTLEQLRIATGALKDMPEMSRAQRALREMEGVK